MFIYEELFKIIKELPVGESKTILKHEGNEIYVLRPEKKFKNYDIEKNFQVYLKTRDGKEFRPNHLIIMLDLNLRTRSNPNEIQDLLILFDSIFYKKDYSESLKAVIKINFEHSLYDITIISSLYILLLIEQEYNYPSEKSKYNPATLFLHGWVRQFICNVKEIDIMTISVCNRQPPLVQFTSQDDGNHKNFNENREELWYFSR